MAYASVDDLVARYGTAELRQLTDDAKAGVPDADKMGRALADASGVVDGYLAGRYRLPLAGKPDALVRANCQIARWLLYRTQRPEHVQQDYDQALAWLRDVAKGVGAIPNAPNVPTSASEETSAGFAAVDPVDFFAAEPIDLRGW